MRFFKCSSFDSKYLALFYAAHPDLADQTYVEHRAALMADCYGWSDYWQQNLQATGKVVCADVVINAEALQKQWARENGVSWSGSGWALEILLAQIKEFQPQVLFTHDFVTVTPAFRRMVREVVPSIRMVVGWDGVARCDTAHFAGCDLMLSCARHVVDYYRGQGMRSEFFKLGFESSLLERIDSLERTTECSFIGSIYLGAHEKRFRRIAEIARQELIDLHLTVSHGRFLRSRLGLLARGEMGALWRIRRSWLDYKFLTAESESGLFGLAMYRKLAESQVGLNIHIDASGGLSGNMRLFEVTGMGTCLLTDRKDNLGDLFEEGREVVVFDHAADAVEKLRWLRENPDVRDQIARAGQARTLRDHSLNRSIEEFADSCLSGLA